MYDEDIDTENTTVTLAVLRSEAPCLCMTCWGETDQVECSLNPANTKRNLDILADIHAERMWDRIHAA